MPKRTTNDRPKYHVGLGCEKFEFHISPEREDELLAIAYSLIKELGAKNLKIGEIKHIGGLLAVIADELVFTA